MTRGIVPNPKKRRFLRFTLRSLLLSIVFFCVVFDWKVERTQEQRDAAHWVAQFGGDVYYDYQVDNNGRRVRNAQPPAPKWLIKHLGIDFFDDVVGVGFINVEIPGDVSTLAELRSIKWLCVYRVPLSDLVPLAHMSKLEVLHLEGTQVCDVTPLAGLTSLRKLYLKGAEVGDVAALLGLTSLEILDLSHTQVHDVTPLAGLTNLKELYLHNTQVRDLAPLHGLTNLKQLTLEGTPVGVSTFRYLKSELPQCVTDLDVVLEIGLESRKK